MISKWALEEGASVDLGDRRLDGRMAVVLSALGNHPNLSIPAACGGHGEMQAAYRFFDNDKVTFDKVLAPHAVRTRERMRAQGVVLLAQDTTEIELLRQEVKGVGELDGFRKGVLLHLLHAFTPDGTPLGTVAAEVLNRPEVSHDPRSHKQRRRKHQPIEEKESLRWLTALRQARQIALELPEVQCVCMADSEADIYEWFAEPRGGSETASGTRAEDSPRVDWLIRACQDRALAAEPDAGNRYLRDAVRATEALYRVEILIRGREAKTQVEDRARRQTRQSRGAEVEVRARTLALRPPWRVDRKLPGVTVNVVMISEPNAPPGELAVEWILITTLPIETRAQVRQVVEYYCVRWNIEILFRTLKSGCRVERRRFEDVERVLPCLALYLIVAWRTLFVCRMGRDCPDADCESIFEPSEWKAVWAAVRRKKPPKKRPRLAEMVHLIAGLGGYIERPSSEPGPQSLWIGLQRMYDLAAAWDAFGPDSRLSTS
jgi:hypothetical protein